MLITFIVGLALVTGAMAVIAVLLALMLWLVWTGRVTVQQPEVQPSVGWDKVPSVLHRVKGMR